MLATRSITLLQHTQQFNCINLHTMDAVPRHQSRHRAQQLLVIAAAYLLLILFDASTSAAAHNQLAATGANARAKSCTCSHSLEKLYNKLAGIAPDADADALSNFRSRDVR